MKPHEKWWRVLIEQSGVKYYFTVLASDILTAINTVMVHQECGVECVIKAKPRSINAGFIKLIEKFPGKTLFRGKVEEDGEEK